MLETNPRVLQQAAALDAERKEQGKRGPLHGIPILLKDNMATDVGLEGAHLSLAVAFELLLTVCLFPHHCQR